MPLDFDAPEDAAAGGGNFLTTPGTYHFVVSHVDERAKKNDGTPMDAICIHATVVDGTTRKDGVCTEREREVKLTLHDPKPTSKDGGEFSRKKQARAFIALGAMKPSDLGKRGIKIDLTQCVGRQFVAKIEVKEGDKGGKFADLAYADIFHIDDPDAKDYPKSEQAIAMIPAAMRLPAEAFACMKAGGVNATGASGGNGSTASPASSSTPATPAPTSTSLDDDVAALLLAE